MQQEQDGHQRHHDHFLHEGAGQGGDSSMDQFGAVIDRFNPHPFGQTGFNFRQPGFHIVDRVQGILIVAGHGCAADGFAFAVQFGDAAPFIRPQFDPGDVAQQHWHSAFRLNHQLFQIGDAAQIALAAHHVFGLGHFHHSPADIAVAGADHFADPHQRNTVSLQLARVHDHLILLDKAADAGDFGNALGLGELVADEPVLRGAQFRQSVAGAGHYILINPADPAGIRAKAGRNARRQASGGGIQIFQHPRPRPVQISPVLENHIDEGRAEEGKAAHHLGAGHAQHRGTQRISDLILHHLRSLAGIVGVDDHLRVRQIGQRIERDVAHRINPASHQENRADQHQKDIAGRGRDQAFQHVSGSRDDDLGQSPLPPLFPRGEYSPRPLAGEGPGERADRQNH